MVSPNDAAELALTERVNLATVAELIVAVTSGLFVETVTSFIPYPRTNISLFDVPF